MHRGGRGITRRKRSPKLLTDTVSTTTTEHTVVPTSVLKDFLEITHSEDDAQIEAHRATARDFFDRITGHRINRETRRAVFDQTGSRFEIPSKPVASIDSVSISYEGAETAQTVSEFYLYDANPPEVRTKEGQAWGSPADSVIIEYVAGYENEADIPDGIAEVLKKMVSDLYENRTTFSQESNVPRELAMTWKTLVTPYRIIRL